jgi:hypothetical protein
MAKEGLRVDPPGGIWLACPLTGMNRVFIKTSHLRLTAFAVTLRRGKTAARE